MTPDPIHIACSADTNYMSDAAVMLHSLFTANPGEVFVVHFMYDARLGAQDLQGLAEVCTKFGQQFDPMLIPEKLKAVFPFMQRFGGFNAWYRVLLPRLLPDRPKILYLDVDLLIVDRVRPLWETPLDGKCIAAITNPLFDYMVKRVQDDLGLPDGKAYFNSGVMLFDLDAMRRFNATDKIVEFISSGRAPMPWADQEPLNAILWQQRVHLPPRWNAMPALWELPWRYLPWTHEQMTEAREHPAIVHFLGPYKPWHYRNRSPYRHTYYEHLAHTRWKDRPVTGRSLGAMLLRPVPVMWQWSVERNIGLGLGWMRKQAVRALRVESPLGSLARDGYRWLTPNKERSRIAHVIEAFALSRDRVFFIQVGSNDGNHGDPLRHHVLARHWKGILVEPVPYVFARLRENYGKQPGLTLENSAIGPKDGTLPFYHLAQTDEALPEWYDQLGSFLRANIDKHADYIPNLEQRIVETPVQCLTFESLCRKHQVGHLDLLHIDAEGFDFEVIKLIKFDTHAPDLLLYEHKHLNAADLAACDQLLEARGYEWIRDGADTLCLRRGVAGHALSRLGRAWALARR